MIKTLVQTVTALLVGASIGGISAKVGAQANVESTPIIANVESVPENTLATICVPGSLLTKSGALGVNVGIGGKNGLLSVGLQSDVQSGAQPTSAPSVSSGGSTAGTGQTGTGQTGSQPQSQGSTLKLEVDGNLNPLWVWLNGKINPSLGTILSGSGNPTIGAQLSVK